MDYLKCGKQTKVTYIEAMSCVDSPTTNSENVRHSCILDRFAASGGWRPIGKLLEAAPVSLADGADCYSLPITSNAF